MNSYYSTDQIQLLAKGLEIPEEQTKGLGDIQLFYKCCKKLYYLPLEKREERIADIIREEYLKQQHKEKENLNQVVFNGKDDYKPENTIVATDPAMPRGTPLEFEIIDEAAPLTQEAVDKLIEQFAVPSKYLGERLNCRCLIVPSIIEGERKKESLVNYLRNRQEPVGELKDIPLSRTAFSTTTLNQYTGRFEPWK